MAGRWSAPLECGWPRGRELDHAGIDAVSRGEISAATAGWAGACGRKFRDGGWTGAKPVGGFPQGRAGGSDVSGGPADRGMGIAGGEWRLDLCRDDGTGGLRRGLPLDAGEARAGWSFRRELRAAGAGSFFPNRRAISDGGQREPHHGDDGRRAAGGNVQPRRRCHHIRSGAAGGGWLAANRAGLSIEAPRFSLHGGAGQWGIRGRRGDLPPGWLGGARSDTRWDGTPTAVQMARWRGFS